MESNILKDYTSGITIQELSKLIKNDQASFQIGKPDLKVYSGTSFFKSIGFKINNYYTIVNNIIIKGVNLFSSVLPRNKRTYSDNCQLCFKCDHTNTDKESNDYCIDVIIKHIQSVMENRLIELNNIKYKGKNISNKPIFQTEFMKKEDNCEDVLTEMVGYSLYRFGIVFPSKNEKVWDNSTKFKENRKINSKKTQLATYEIINDITNKFETVNVFNIHKLMYANTLMTIRFNLSVYFKTEPTKSKPNMFNVKFRCNDINIIKKGSDRVNDDILCDNYTINDSNPINQLANKIDKIYINNNNGSSDDGEDSDDIDKEDPEDINNKDNEDSNDIDNEEWNDKKYNKNKIKITNKNKQ